MSPPNMSPSTSSPNSSSSSSSSHSAAAMPTYKLAALDFTTISSLMDYLRAVLYTIVFHRSLGIVKPVDCQTDSFHGEIWYCKPMAFPLQQAADDLQGSGSVDGTAGMSRASDDIDSKVEQSIQQFCSRLEQVTLASSKALQQQQSQSAQTIRGNLKLGFFDKLPATSSDRKQRSHSTTSDDHRSSLSSSTANTPPSTSSSGWFSAISSSIASTVQSARGAVVQGRGYHHRHSTSNADTISSSRNATQLPAEHDPAERAFWEWWVVPIAYVHQLGAKPSPSPSPPNDSSSTLRPASRTATIASQQQQQQQLEQVKATLQQIITLASERTDHIPFVSSKVSKNLPLLFPFEIVYSFVQENNPDSSIVASSGGGDSSWLSTTKRLMQQGPPR